MTLRDADCVDKLKQELSYARLGSNKVCKVYDIPHSGDTNKYQTIYVRNPETNRGTKVSLGRAALIVKKGTFFINKDEHDKCEASHLCHNKNCVLLNHIHAEPHHINCSRKLCVHSGFCLGHGVHPDCLVTLKMW